MAKWADYLISEVKYVETTTTKHISKVKVHVDENDKVGTATIWTRQDVINAIDLKSTFKTIFKNDENKWRQGALVEKIKLSDDWYIKTLKDNTKKDNLGELPEF